MSTFDVQCVHKNKANYFLALHHQPQLDALIFFQCDLRDNYESANGYVFHLTCVMPTPGKTFQTHFGRRKMCSECPV